MHPPLGSDLSAEACFHNSLQDTAYRIKEEIYERTQQQDPEQIFIKTIGVANRWGPSLPPTTGKGTLT